MGKRRRRPAPQAEPRSRRATALLTIASPLLALAVLEGALRLAGVGFSTGFFVEREGRVRVSNPRFAELFFPAAVARRPLDLQAPAQKPQGALRVCVVGGSAAQGDPAPSYGFSRFLEVLLAHAQPGRGVEMLNASVTALNSHGARLAAIDCARLSPDLLIVYAGNNEVVGPYGPGTAFAAARSRLWVIRLGLTLRSTRLGQVLSEFLSRKAPAPTQRWRGMEAMLEREVSADDPRLESVYRQFRENLRGIAAAGRRARARVLFLTVPTNLDGNPPFASGAPDLPSPQARSAWEEALKRGAALAEGGRHAQALASLKQAGSLYAEHAELQFRIARSLSALGKSEAAREHDGRARDLDRLRFRADSKIRSALIAIAEAEGAALVDAEAALGGRSEFFLDHVHPNARGNYEIAKAVFALLHPNAVPLDFASSRERLALSSWDRVRILETMRGRLRRRPFTDQTGANARLAGLSASLQSARSELRRGPAEAVALYEKALRGRPGDPVLLANFGSLLAEFGQAERAVASLQQAAAALPHGHNIKKRLADMRAGRIAEGIGVLEEMLALVPEDAETTDTLRTLRAMPAAEKELREAVALAPEFAAAHNDLGAVLAREGRLQEALEQFREAVRLDPSDPGARGNLAQAERMLRPSGTRPGR